MFVFHNPMLIISAARSEQWPESELNEVLMVGKSNVGKSSLINALVNRKSLAYVGQTPGKTRLLNFYNLDDKLMLVDAPGYGYAKRSKQEYIDYGKMMGEYLKKRTHLKGCLLILDIRHEPSNNDITMYNYLKETNSPLLIVLTKTDKLSYSQQLKMKKLIAQGLNVSNESFVLFSSSKKTGVQELWEKIDKTFLGNTLQGISE